MTRPVAVRAPGKINLYLAVGPARPDGFHPLATVFQAVSIYDDILAEPAPSGFHLTMGGRGRDLPCDDSNLAIRAARAVAEAAGITSGVRLHIEKRIPVAGGMAGGSADAAGTLVACREMWQADLTDQDLHAIAADLGSDVPFCLHGGTAVGYGRGEELTPTLCRERSHYLLAIMEEGLSTPAVFREFDAQTADAPEPAIAPAFLQALAQGDNTMVSYLARNDLAGPAATLHEGVRRISRFFCSSALQVMVSGSGPTLVGFVDTPARGALLQARLSQQPGVADALMVHGPVAGIEHIDPAPLIQARDANHPVLRCIEGAQ